MHPALKASPSLRDWRLWLATLGLLASAGTGAGFLRDAGLGGYTPLRIVTTLVALVLAVSLWRPVLQMLPNPVVWVFVAWSVASLIWTQSTTETLTTLVGLGGTFAFGVVLAVLHRSFRVDTLMMWTFTATTLVSYVLILLVPSVGRQEVNHPTEGQFLQAHGVFIWNSDLGFSAAIAAVIAVSAFVHRWRTPRWWLIVVALLNMGMVVMSNAATSAIVLAVGLGVLIVTAGRLVMLGVVGLGVVGTAVGMVLWGVTGFFDQVLGLLGRSSTLTGRSALWESTLEQAESTKVLGKGAGVEPVFWGISRAEHSHNGFIQVYFDRGIVGAVLVVAVFLFAIYLIARQRDRLAAALLAMLVMANMANNYLSYASLGLMLLFLLSHVSLPGERGLRPAEQSNEQAAGTVTGAEGDSEPAQEK